MSYQQGILQTWNQEFSKDKQEKSNQRDPDTDTSRNDMKDEYKIRNYISFLQTST